MLLPPTRDMNPRCTTLTRSPYCPPRCAPMRPEGPAVRQRKSQAGPCSEADLGATSEPEPRPKLTALSIYGAERSQRFRLRVAAPAMMTRIGLSERSAINRTRHCCKRPPSERRPLAGFQSCMAKPASSKTFCCFFILIFFCVLFLLKVHILLCTSSLSMKAKNSLYISGIRVRHQISGLLSGLSYTGVLFPFTFQFALFESALPDILCS